MGNSLSLACEVSGGKPAPKLVWKRNSYKLPEENMKTSITDEEDGRQKVVSTLNLNPTSDGNGAYYACESESNFTSVMLSAGVTLDVQYPPGRPTIEGYREHEKIRAGDTVSIRCVSRGGNPLAWLVWTKNGDFIDHSYMTSDGEAVNEITFTASPADDKALYLCTASSSMTSERMEKSIRLKVLYAPSSITIEAPNEAKPGDVISATCKTGRSNPAAEVTWVVDGVPYIGENLIEEDENGGWTSTSMLNVNVTKQDRSAKLFTCYAVNQELGETKLQTLAVSILYAPDPPSIFGYSEGTPIAAEKLQRLTCVSHGGNPLPDLKWYKGEEEIKQTTKQITSGNIISRELLIITSASDNGARYQCKSTSKALSKPLVSSITLAVYFAPSNVTIKVRPKRMKTGSEIKLYCQSTLSNPAANITWWKGRKNEVQLVSISESVTPAKDGGGYISKASISLNVTTDDDGSLYTCQAENLAIQQSVHDTIILSVLYRPTFPKSDPAIVEVKENDSTIVDMSAKANPSNVSYKWTRKGEVIQEGPILNITAAERAQSGEYVCQASNEIGEATLTVVLKVLYPATLIISDSEKERSVIVAEPESNVKLQCTADGYPLPDDVIKWERPDFKMDEKTETLFKGNGKSIIGIKNVTREITGEFTCTANNGIGSPSSRKIFLMVKHEPVIQKEVNSTVFSNRGITVQLYCTAGGVPNINFTWSLEGVIITPSKKRMKGEIFQLDHITWQGILTIDDVVAEDFGEYKCIARNEIGFDTYEITLLPDSAPDPPVLIRVLNATNDAIHLRWVPGFDGGHNQTYRVRYKTIFDPSFTYIDVHPPESNYLWLKDLKPETEYELAIMSINEKGNSPYSDKLMKTKTLGLSTEKPQLEEAPSSLNYFLIEVLGSAVGAVFLILFLFNIVLLSLYYHKKKPRLKKDYSGSDLSSSTGRISTSSEINSEETTFTDESYEKTVDRTSTYDTESISSSESISESISSTNEDEDMRNYSYDTFREPVSGALV